MKSIEKKLVGIQVSVDLDEGTRSRVCCLSCKDSDRATYMMATPVRMYVVALACDECGEQLVAWDIDPRVSVEFIDRLWRAA